MHGIGGIPEDDGGDDQVETRGSVLLGLMAAVDDSPLPEGVDGLRKGMPLLALVEPGLAAAPERGIFQPIEHEERSLDLSDLLQGNVHLVLAFVGSEFSQHDRRRSVTGLKRCHQTRDVVPMLADYIGTNTLAEKRRDRRIVRRRCDRDQPSIRKVAQSRTEAEPKHGAERKHVIGCPAGVSVVLRYGEIASMMEEPVKDSRIIAALDTSPSMLYRVRKQLVEEGLEAVLSRKQRAAPAVARIFDGEKEAKLIALACSKPPKGRARWTLRLLENKVVELGIVARASDSTIGRTLKKTRSSRIAGSAG